MYDYLFSWKMTRRRAKKVVKKQFYRYYFVQHFLKWFFLCESFFWILIFFDVNKYTMILSIIIGFFALVLIYSFYYLTMLPEKSYMAEYQAGFAEDHFFVNGKNYQRQYTYDEIDRLIVKEDSLIFLTKYEGVLLPLEVFNCPEQKQEFIDRINLLKR